MPPEPGSPSPAIWVSNPHEFGTDVSDRKPEVRSAFRASLIWTVLGNPSNILLHTQKHNNRMNNQIQRNNFTRLDPTTTTCFSNSTPVSKSKIWNERCLIMRSSIKTVWFRNNPEYRQVRLHAYQDDEVYNLQEKNRNQSL